MGNTVRNMVQPESRVDYYERYKGPDVFRINLLRDASFVHEVTNNRFRLEIVEVNHEIILDGSTSGW